MSAIEANGVRVGDRWRNPRGGGERWIRIVEIDRPDHARVEHQDGRSDGAICSLLADPRSGWTLIERDGVAAENT